MTFLTIISREVETWVQIEISERRLIERDVLFFYENVKKGEEQSERSILPLNLTTSLLTNF